jgi:ferredoxin
MEKMKVNSDACIGCGVCQALSPDVFEINDDGLAVAKDVDLNKLDTETKKSAMDALESCPVGAIEIKKED